MGNNKTKEVLASNDEVEQVGQEVELPELALLYERVRQSIVIYIWSIYQEDSDLVPQETIDECVASVFGDVSSRIAKAVEQCMVVKKDDRSAGKVPDVNGDSESQSNG
jgi:hypothetical protein